MNLGMIQCEKGFSMDFSPISETRLVVGISKAHFQTSRDALDFERNISTKVEMIRIEKDFPNFGKDSIREICSKVGE